MPLSMDLSAKGFEMFFKPWQVVALKYLISIRPEGANSREVYVHVSSKMEISRSTLINFLNALVDDSVLEYTETTGKGGHHRIYSIPYDESEFKQFLAEQFFNKLKEEYAEETMNALNKFK